MYLDSLSPNLLALLAAICISVARAMYRGALIRLGAGVTALTSSAITLQFAWAFYFFSDRVKVWPLRGLAWFVLVGLIGGLAGRYLSFYAMKTVGLASTSVLMQTSLLWSSLLAVVFLGEVPTLPIIAGSALIMVGSILLVYRAGEEPRSVPFFYYLIPLAAAGFQGFSHLFRKFGFAWISSAPLGMSISNTVATLSLFFVLFYANEREPRFWERRPLLLISVGAVFNAAAAIFFWTAVRHGDIVEVIPINRLSVFLAILFSWLYFRKQEEVGFRVVLGGLLSVAGAWAIVWGK
jgi:transporter family protein